MAPLTFVLLAVAGGFGAAARLVLDGVIRTRVAGTVPWGTIVVNVTGSFALGLLTALAAGRLVPEAWHLVVGTGFLGGYTTFSTASFETMRLLQERRWTIAVLNGLGVLITAVAAAALGLWIGGLR